MALKFFYRKSAKDGQWRWRLMAENQKLIAESGEGYHNRDDCLHAIQLIKSGAATAAVDESDQKD